MRSGASSGSVKSGNPCQSVMQTEDRMHHPTGAKWRIGLEDGILCCGWRKEVHID